MGPEDIDFMLTKEKNISLIYYETQARSVVHGYLDYIIMIQESLCNKIF